LSASTIPILYLSIPIPIYYINNKHLKFDLDLARFQEYTQKRFWLDISTSILDLVSFAGDTIAVSTGALDSTFLCVEAVNSIHIVQSKP
jgi:hypothetical protein